jgi:hypothetical protein
LILYPHTISKIKLIKGNQALPNILPIIIESNITDAGGLITYNIKEVKYTMRAKPARRGFATINNAIIIILTVNPNPSWHAKLILLQ